MPPGASDGASARQAHSRAGLGPDERVGPTTTHEALRRVGRSKALGRAAIAVVTAVVLGAPWACYGPKIGPGLRCAPAPAMRCPDGFVCASELCVPAGSVAVGGATGSGAGGTGESSTGGGPSQGGSDPGAGGGVGGGGGAAGTGAPGGAAGAAGTRTLGQTCVASSTGLPSGSSNDCVAGLECVGDCAGAGARCYQPCASDVDCPDSACSRTAPVTGHAICEIAYTTCDPIARTGCSAITERCYLLSASLSGSGRPSTVCDCSLDAGAVGDPCSDSRACAPGLVCPPQGSGLGSGYCRRLCDLVAAVSGCAGDQACHPFGTKWGYCF